jgi:hypothetical protein
METLPNAEIELIHDKEYEERYARYYGKYLGTFLSAGGQVRADLFDRGKEVHAFVSFPTGLNAGNAEDRYYNELLAYAESHGFADRFRFMLVE